MRALAIKPRVHVWAASIAALLIVVVAIFTVTTRFAHADTPTVSAGEHIMNVYDDGAQKGFITKATTLRDALAGAGVHLSAYDRTEPSLDTTLVAASYDVNIYRARPVIIRDGDTETKVVTAYRSAKQIVAQAGLTLHNEDEVELAPSTDLTANGAAEVLTIHRATQFTFYFYGKALTAYTQAKTVGDMLQKKGITLSAKDYVTPAVSTPITPGMTVKLWRDGAQTLTVEEAVPYTTKQIADADQPLGYKKVETPGVNGTRTATYTVVMSHGQEVSRSLINSTITQQAVEQVEVIGTKVELPPGSHEDWMAAAGISASDYGYVNYIVDHEDRSWDPCKVQGGAVNCEYNGLMGYGLVQSTPGYKMATAGSDWRTNPITQLRWASSYMLGRYGSWQAAYNHWVLHHNW